MGVGMKALLSGACVVVAHAVVALFAPGLYGWAWTWPYGVGVVSAGAWLLAFALAITPEQRRDTRGSAHPFQCGAMVVHLTVIEGPAALPGRRTLPPAASPPTGGLPPVVEGSVIEQDRDR